MYYCLFLFSFLFSFDKEASLVDSIIINGNEKTKDHIIIREIKHPYNNSPLDSVILMDDINRLYNLGIFSNIEIFVENNIYNINVIESFNIYPIPLLEYNETKDELSYGPALAHSNLLGMNQKIFLGSFIYGDTGYILGYYNPWLYGNRINLGFLALNLNPENIFYNYNYRFILNKISSGFSLDKIHRYNYELGFMKIDIYDIPIDHEYYHEIYSKPLKYNYFTSTFNYQHDIRDIYIDPKKGHLLNISLEYFYGINDIEDIWVLSIMYKKFYEFDFISKPVFSYRIETKNKFPEFDRLPLLSYEYLGGEEFVRGYSSLPDEIPEKVRPLIESSNMYVISLELQNTIFKRKDYGRVEIGLDGILFFDMGTSSKNYKSIDFSHNISGYGVGLKLFVSSIGSISISLGFNPYGQQHLHLMDSQ